MQQPFQVAFFMITDKIIRGTVHQADQFFTLIDDGNPLPPGQGSGPKTHDLDILLFCEQVRNSNGVVFDKIKPVILVDFGIEKCFEVDYHSSQIATVGIR